MAESGAHRSPFSTLSYIAKSTTLRTRVLLSYIFSFCLIPFARAAEPSDKPVRGFNEFVARPSNDSKVLADVQSLLTPFTFGEWRRRGLEIRKGENRAQCFGNLSLALSEIGSLYQAGSAGASGALTLLPTAGALIGAPAKELWVLFKLVPLAGFLSMLLSLGGNIVPQHLTDYEETAFSYGGMIATETKSSEAYDQPPETTNLSPKAFAQHVRARALNPHGSSKRLVAAIGIFSQLVWIGIILLACYMTQSGGVVTWWCKAWGWMHLWYLMVALSSLLENLAGVPFTKQWTMRVSKAPGTVDISEDAPIVIHGDVENQEFTRDDAKRDKGQAYQGVIEMMPLNNSSDVISNSDERPPLRRRYTNFLQVLDGPGINTTGRVTMSRDQAWSASRHSFYVILSVAGIGHGHATLRVISKAISVGVFAAGTATFASATLLTISIALTTLCLILGAGVFGRVASLWMASKFMEEQPIIQRTVKNQDEANRFIMTMLEIPGLTFELKGHVFLNGRCIYRYNPWLRWSAIFGILTEPFRVDKLLAK
jgi:hypothetical protein